MNKLYPSLFILLILFIGPVAFAQQQLVSETNKKELRSFSVKSTGQYRSSHKLALSRAGLMGWAVKRHTKNGGRLALQGINSLGFPVYLITDNNTTAAATTQTNAVQPGGSLGLNLSGSSVFLNHKLAIWDGGWVYAQHQEFAGKTISFKDTSSVIEHATHVAGTMIAKGVYAPAKGMAFNAGTLLSYDFDNDVAEMSAAAPNLLLSNHSYGDQAGWNFNDLQNRWEWYGLPGDTVDYNYGFYNGRAQAWDKIAYNAPYYLIVESAGNSRASTGPPVGQDYWGFKSRTDANLVDKGPRPANISSNNSYDVISTTGNAKNILTVGAVNPLPFGPVNRSDVSVTFFSSYGPTDDGRVKPDIMGMGLNVLSTNNAGPASYATLSGTSQSAPNITGSLYLLQEYYAQKNNGSFMRAATLKGLACHTAFDAGNIGPDYIYGWGLLDMRKAAQAITDNGGKSIIQEKSLPQGQTQTTKVVASGSGALVASISWTDPQAAATPEGTINSRTPKLVNDLDIRVSDGVTTYLPWVLDPDKPATPATNGDNIRDNIEQVYVANAVPGRQYTISVSHKAILQSAKQDYSLIVTGIGGAAYCASQPLSNADSRINNVTLSNLNNTPAAGCTSYTDYTNLTVQLEQGKTYPLSLTLGTCGVNFNKVAKVYIDWNGNGVFDPSELVATTPVISNTATYTANITVPANVIPGYYSLMRVVLSETADPSTVNSCGTYAKGETQDYRVQFLQTSLDAGVIAIVSPSASGNCSGPGMVTVRLKNFGSVNIANIPVTVSITAADNTVTNFAQTYMGTIAPNAEADFNFDATFNVSPGATYNITAKTNLPGDLVTANNQVNAAVVISPSPVASGLLAYHCDSSNTYYLTGSGDGELFWYQNNNDTLPIAYGAGTTTTQASVNNTYYAGLNDFSAKVGPAAKTAFSGGGYNQFTPFIKVTTKIPVVIESARLYIGNPGKITFSATNTSGEIVATTTIDATATRTVPLPGAQPDDPADQGKVFMLNLELPGAGDYTISTTYDSNATIYRSNAGVASYPFTVGNLFSITGNTATSPTDTAYYKNFYYYLYDIQLRSPGCASASRQAVVVTKPMITQAGNTLSSSFTTGNQWYFDGRPISGATGQTYQPFEPGNYQVGSLLTSGCIALSDNFTYANKLATNHDDIGLLAYPVPANSQINVLFAAKSTAVVNVSLVNSAGQIVYSDKQQIAAGIFSSAINVAQQTPGMYILKVVIGNKLYSKKVIIGR